MPRDGRKTLYPNGKADVASSFLFSRTIKGYSGSQMLFRKNRKLKDEYGEFVSIAGFWLAGVIIAMWRYEK
jgi:hypothetical protein